MPRTEPTSCPECGADFCHVHNQEPAPLPDLKPCPFCGGSADLSDCDVIPSERFYAVMCLSCSAYLSDNSEQSVVARWNTRIISDDEEIIIDIPLRGMMPQEVFRLDEGVDPCANCCATLELGSLFCSQCRNSKFSQFLAKVSAAKEEIPLPAPGRSL